MLPLRWRREEKCPTHSWFNKTGPLRFGQHVSVCQHLSHHRVVPQQHQREGTEQWKRERRSPFWCTCGHLHLQRPPAEELSHKLWHASLLDLFIFPLNFEVTSLIVSREASPLLFLAQPEKTPVAVITVVGREALLRWHRQMMRKPQPGWSRQQVTEKLHRAAANYECTAAAVSRACH